MKKIILFIIIIISAALTFAQNTWERTSDFPGGQQRVFALTTTHSNSIIAESRGTGIFRSTNNGVNWTLVSSTEKYLAALYTAPNGTLYALNTVSYASVDIARSTDDGITWNRVYFRSTPDNFYAEGGVISLPNGHMVASLERIVGQLVSDASSLALRSTDSGASWTVVWDDSAVNRGTLKDFHLLDNKIFASYSTGLGLVCPVVYSSDEGFSWVSPATSFTAFGNSLTVDASGNLYAGTYGAENVTEKLFVSSDLGLTWQNGGLPGGSIYTVFVASNGDIYAASDYSNSPYAPKVRRSTDHGQSWGLLLDGMPLSLRTYAFTENAAGDIFAGTNISLTNIPGGVFILRNIIGIHSINEEIPSSYSLSQNYPNPFNPSTNIGFRIADFGLVRLTIFDISGRQISELVNKELKQGNYEVNWNAENISSGIYFYKLETGKFTETKKMILIK